MKQNLGHDTAQRLPEELYVCTVDALYADARSLLIGATSAALAAAVTASKSGDWMLLACAIALFVVGMVRAFDMRGYARTGPKPLSAARARHWEIRYMVGSCTVYAVLGAWGFLAFTRTADPTIHLISFSVIIAYMVGITGRNFSNDAIVTSQTILVAVPMTVALMLQGTAPHAFLALLLLPFFLSIRFISARLRRTLFDAVEGAQEVRSLAERFDTALNNMPHGLAMFDPDHTLLVRNGQFDELLRMSGGAHDQGTRAEELFARCVFQGILVPAHLDILSSAFEEIRMGMKPQNISIQATDGRTLEFSFRTMANGGFVVVVEDITERRAAEARIRYLARFDPLTGLPNRAQFRSELERLLARGANGSEHALLFIDLDQFKHTNDTLGHPCGDALLCEVAKRLRRIVRPSDIVARFGGDEFVVLQPLHAGKEEAAHLAQRIIDAVSEVYEIEHHQILIGASIGIALSPRDGTNADQLMKRADIALYSAKADGRGVWRFFERDMDVRAQERRSLELDLRTALSEQQFEVRYQPIMDIRRGRITSCEALLRWPHPERGMVSPAEFIPVAEETGLITDIGKWVLLQACRECAGWPEHVRVAVNFSPSQFRRGDVCADVEYALGQSGLAPDRLEIEITESVFLQETPMNLAMLHRLRGMGVRISLDDFGTGYSSLSYLQRFPLNKVKIDRSFLAGLESDGRSLVLLHGIARLSGELGMSVVVEGVETQEQLKLLAKEENITEVQGFLFSPAIPARDIREMIGAGNIHEMLGVA